MQQQRQQRQNINDFNTVQLSLASPEKILEWSYGEVTKPETINYRTQRPEKGGLFDEKIFGPEKDYECYCGKYRGIRYRGIVCEKCGVEITRSVVRRERMGHIELAGPVAHIWFLRSIPSRISLLLGLSASDVERVIYFAGYIITHVAKEEKDRLLKELDAEYKNKVKTLSDSNAKAKLKDMLVTAKSDIESIVEGRVLDEATYHRFSVKYGAMFEADIGAEAIYNIFKNLDMAQLCDELAEKLESATSAERDKLRKRLALARSMLQSGVRPEWMFLIRIPVTPAALRPMVALEGGRHATSDVNDLYRRVINRNNRLKKLMGISAPDVILRNEKRIMQEAVDALIDNSIRHGGATMSVTQAQRRPLKSLSDYLKGKQGYFRQNLLGKRVDYSGRSVIVVGPTLSLEECGLPKHMARELFRPFIIAKLLEREIAYNIRGANRLIDDGIAEVWAILEEVIQDKYVLLNRAPTLHRQGIQAFKPVLIEGSAIQIHPLVCQAFNADFDGDQMAVHVPLSAEAQLEAREWIAATNNVLKPGNGEVVASMRQDMVLGCYWMTKVVEGENGEGKAFPSPNNAILAYDYGQVSMRAKITVLPTDSEKYKHFNGETFETTVGRLLFNSVLPRDFPFLNEELSKKGMSALIDTLVEEYGLAQLPEILDKMKGFGFEYATKSGITWGMDDVQIPEAKSKIVAGARAKNAEVNQQYEEGLLSADEKRRKNIEIWHQAKNDVEEALPDAIDPKGSVYDMLTSGARGSLGQITQMAGMKGLITDTRGEIIEFPIIASMKEGLTPIEYFVTTHGARKGLSDTALQTAKAGYLTRRLFDVAQDIVVSEEDCKTKGGVTISRRTASGVEMPLEKNIRGRVLAAELKNDAGEQMFKKGHLISAADAREIEAAGIESVFVRTPMSCASLSGVCRQCYGWDLTTNDLVDVGEAVGTVAAQAIGEPGTQLTMRTFHSGGVSSAGGDITSGLPRVEEVFDKRAPKHPAVVATISGTVSDVTDTGKEKQITVLADAGEKTTKAGGKEVTYTAHFMRMPLVAKGDHVAKGDLLTDGSAVIDELFKHGGSERAHDYIISEISKIYELQGASISRKHIEVIIKQMFARRRVKDPGNTSFTAGDVVETIDLERENARIAESGGEQATAEPLVLGITEVALSRKSFLSASSFQNTTKILINSALKGAKDHLTGLKENVIIGRLIPAGTGFDGSKKHARIEELRAELAEAEAARAAEVEESSE